MTFFVIRELGVSSTCPTRGAFHAGKQVKREREMKRFLPFGNENARSILNKTTWIKQYIKSLDLAVLTIKETWTKSLDLDVLTIKETWAKAALD